MSSTQAASVLADASTFVEALQLPAEARRLGVYVHYPYCVKRCPYCDFTVTTRKVDDDLYRDAVLAELALRATELPGRPPAESLYFGGGTPGLWAPAAIGAVVEAVARGVGLVAGAEITVECNPGEVSLARFQALRAVGVNRISLGAQSFDDRWLRALGRTHTAADVRAAVADLHAAGIPNHSVDLIYGLADQTPEDAAADATAALALGAPHVSTYQLTVEPRTAFGLRAARGADPAADDDRQAEVDAAVRATLEAGGVRFYEVSNAARPGFEAVHNGLYWAYAEYLGLGVGAHGLRHTASGAERTANVPQIGKWARALAAGRLAEVPRVAVDAAGVAEERVLVGLRRREGLAADAGLRHRFGSAAAALVARGLLTDDGQRWRTTPAGLQLLDKVVLDLVTG